MNQWIANAITSWSLGTEYDRNSEKFQIVSYGILLTIETVYKIIILIFLGEIIGAFPETIAFFIGFCGLRKNAGGFHMRSSAGCMLSVMLMWTISITGSMLRMSFYSNMILSFVTLFLVAVYAPCTTSNNPINDVMLRKRKRINAIAYVIIVSIIAYFFEFNGYLSVGRVLVVSMLLEALTIIHIRKEKKI